MAKKALIQKQQRTPKFKVRGYTRCRRCGRPRAVCGCGTPPIRGIPPASPRRVGEVAETMFYPKELVR